MNIFLTISLLPIVAILAESQTGLRSHRRHLTVNDVSCSLTRVCNTAMDADKSIFNHDHWEAQCDNGEHYKVDESALKGRDAFPGAKMQTPLALIDTDTNTLTIPPATSVEITNINGGNIDRKIGEFTFLVIRVMDKNGLAPDASIEQLEYDIFGREICFRTQMEACSHGKFKVLQFDGLSPTGQLIENGVVDFQLTTHEATHSDFIGQVEQKASEKFGDLYGDWVDFIMLIMPEGQKDLAWAYADDKITFYTNEWGSSVAANMHEVGHNLGLAHSGQIEQGEYDDLTGVMGSANIDFGLQMCYNAQKSYQLGWYDDKVLTIDPLSSNDAREFQLNGVVDYHRAGQHGLVSLRLAQTENIQDYYIGFNHAVRANKDTGEDLNKVTVTRKDAGGHKQYGQSTKLAGLHPGASIELEDFNNSGRSVTVEFLKIKDNTAIVRIYNDQTEIEEPTGSCKNIKVVIRTDPEPTDTSWTIVDRNGNGRAFASPFYDKKDHLYELNVCIPKGPQDTIYDFTIFDSYNDGLCCSQGYGYYKVFDADTNRLLFEGAGFRSEESFAIDIPRDPNYSSDDSEDQAPTEAPTVSPPCDEFEVIVQTDQYAEDSSWEFYTKNQWGDMQLADKRSNFEKNSLHDDKVCLVRGKYYEFHFNDSFQDGMTGWYKILGPDGEEILNEQPGAGEWNKRTHEIEALPNVARTPAPIPATSPPTTPMINNEDCKDISNNRVNFPNIGKAPARDNRTCKWFREVYKNRVLKKQYCLRKVLITSGPREGRRVRLNQVCRKTCADLGRANPNFCPKR